MIHTASLVHDDVLDHAETRRGKMSVNTRWNPQKVNKQLRYRKKFFALINRILDFLIPTFYSQSTMCGDYILAVGTKILAQIGNKEVVQVVLHMKRCDGRCRCDVQVLSQVLADLVLGEFQQLQQTKDDENER